MRAYRGCGIRDRDISPTAPAARRRGCRCRIPRNRWWPSPLPLDLLRRGKAMLGALWLLRFDQLDHQPAEPIECVVGGCPEHFWLRRAIDDPLLRFDHRGVFGERLL